ncbi:MAG: helix-hairpin-helix domain-containing protein [Chloroflexi bacterium]|nr:helix-hairpin-helix domain-containing protein [Chloroflexota bacterium]
MDAWQRYRGYLVLSLGFAILFGGYVLYDHRPQPEPMMILDPVATPALTTQDAVQTPTAPPIRVHVTGAVRRPGVYTVLAGSRLIDAVDAAGGLALGADEARINLADFVSDGQQVFVPYLGTPAPLSPTPLSAGRGAASLAGGSVGLVNINTASAAELETLPGIGPAYAQRIIDYREQNGPFVDKSEIMRVNGIGQACYERIVDRITVD